MTWVKPENTQSIINDKLIIGQSADDLMLEIRNNTWLISMSDVDRQQTTVTELLDFIEKVISNRQLQLVKSPVKHGMKFYLWHDKQASQLRFCLVSDFHTSLPFDTTIEESALTPILSDFLKSKDGIHWDTLDVSDIRQGNA